MDTRRAHTIPHVELLKLKKFIRGVGGISAREREREREAASVSFSTSSVGKAGVAEEEKARSEVSRVSVCCCSDDDDV